MGLNSFLKSLFGDKSARDMKQIQPIVEKIKAAYPEIKALDNDALRARTKEIQRYVQDSAAEQKNQIEELKAKIEPLSLIASSFFAVCIILWNEIAEISKVFPSKL